MLLYYTKLVITPYSVRQILMLSSKEMTAHSLREKDMSISEERHCIYFYSNSISSGFWDVNKFSNLSYTSGYITLIVNNLS